MVGQISDTISKLGTVFLPIVPNWLSSSLKPRTWLYCSSSELYHLDTKEDKRVRSSKALWWTVSIKELSSSIGT